MNGVVVVSAFGKGCLRYAPNAGVRVFKDKQDAVQFLLRHNKNLFGWNFFELDSPEVFAKEEVEYLSKNQNKIVPEIENDKYAHMDNIIERDAIPHKITYITELDVGKYRIEMKGSGIYRRGFELISVDNSEVIMNISIQKFKELLDTDLKFRRKFYSDKIRVRKSKVWVQDPFQRVYTIMKQYYFDEYTSNIIHRYTAKYCKMVPLEEWTGLPYMDGNKITDRK